MLCRAAADKGAQEEAERQLAVVKKLKAEVTRKEGMLKATQAELDKVPFKANTVTVEVCKIKTGQPCRVWTRKLCHEKSLTEGESSCCYSPGME